MVPDKTSHRTGEHTPRKTGLPGEDVGVGLWSPWLGWVAVIKLLDLSLAKPSIKRGVRALRSKCSFININKRRSDRQSSVTVTGVM